MTAKGRPSAEALAMQAIADSSPSSLSSESLDPPSELSPEEASEWTEVVGRVGASYFPRETFGLLVQYCRHVVRARNLAKLIAKAEQDPELDLKAYELLLKMQGKESGLIAALSTKMRLAQQSTISKEAKKKGVGHKPWETN